MLFLLFSAQGGRYAIATREVAEVTPFARLKSMPCCHPALAGLLNLRGEPVPVLDMNLLCGGEQAAPVEERLDSRIILCKGALESAPERLLGLLAEQVTDTRVLDVKDFVQPGVSSPAVRWPGQIYEDKNGSYIQWIHPARILSAEVSRELLQQTEVFE